MPTPSLTRPTSSRRSTTRGSHWRSARRSGTSSPTPRATTTTVSVAPGPTVAGVATTARTSRESGRRVTDWYAQDEDGNVWWFGAPASGRRGPTAPRRDWPCRRRPRVGDGYRTAFAPGVVEDTVRVVAPTRTSWSSRSARTCGPAWPTSAPSSGDRTGAGGPDRGQLPRGAAGRLTTDERRPTGAAGSASGRPGRPGPGRRAGPVAGPVTGCWAAAGRPGAPLLRRLADRVPLLAHGSHCQPSCTIGCCAAYDAVLLVVPVSWFHCCW